MDTIEDTDSAILAFRSLADTTAVGTKYLALYGVLQAMFVQQDATAHLFEAVALGWSPRWHPELEAIRKARNSAIGHPTKQGPSNSARHHFVIQISLTSDSFQLMSRDRFGKSAVQTLHLARLIEQQRQLIGSAISNLHDHLIEEDERHRMHFAGRSLVSSFGPHIHYAFEKVVGSTSGWAPFDLGRFGLETIVNGLASFESEIKSRGLEIATYPGIHGTWQELQHPIERLRSYFDNKADSPLEDADASVFAKYIVDRVEELLHMASEVDEEYRKGGEST